MPDPIPTPHFSYHRPLPFCPHPAIPISSYDIVSNLTLAQIESLFWTTADVSFSFAGEGTYTYPPEDGGETITTNLTGGLALRPVAFEGDFGAIDLVSVYQGAWCRAVDGLPEEGPFYIDVLPEETTLPRERVCRGAELLSVDFSSTGDIELGEGSYPKRFKARFVVLADAEHAGKYAIAYQFLTYAGDPATLPGIMGFVNPAWGSGVIWPGLTLLNAGTFTIGAIEFAYEAWHQGLCTGGTMTAERTVYAYT